MKYPEVDLSILAFVRSTTPFNFVLLIILLALLTAIHSPLGMNPNRPLGFCKLYIHKNINR